MNVAHSGDSSDGFDIILAHGLYSFSGKTFKSPLLDVNFIVGLVNQGTQTHLYNRCGQVKLPLSKLHQLGKHPAGNDILVGGIDKLKVEDLGQQQMPMVGDQVQESLPIDLATITQDDMVDIRCIIAFPVVHV